MPGKPEKPSALTSYIQGQIDDVRAGRSTRLSLETFGSSGLTAIPQEVRGLTGLRSLSLGNAEIGTLPHWLEELPNLESIDIRSAQVTAFSSFLPNIRWAVEANQIIRLG